MYRNLFCKNFLHFREELCKAVKNGQCRVSHWIDLVSGENVYNSARTNREGICRGKLFVLKPDPWWKKVSDL